MTQEEKQLLLVVLCSGLPYGVRISKVVEDYISEPKTPKSINTDGCIVIENEPFDDGTPDLDYWDISEIKPYLRPVSSMSEEEKNELRNILWFGYPSDDNDKYSHRGVEVKQCLYDDEKHSTYDFDDFRVLQKLLLKNHFDYCGLIEKGLALEAPEGMYNIK